MSLKAGYRIKKEWRLCCSILLLQLVVGSPLFSQDTMQRFSVKGGKMYILLSKKILPAALNEFVQKYELAPLGLRRFIDTGNDDSIRICGWKMQLDTDTLFSLIKPIQSADINNEKGRIIFHGNGRQENGTFPAVLNKTIFGYNRFRNKETFAVQDSVVSFFLRNNQKASRVMLAGSFNNWNEDNLPMAKVENGWLAFVKMTPGKHWYKFIIDGNWATDNDNLQNENDGEGNTNSVYYFANTLLQLRGFTNAKKVYLAGSFNNWAPRELLMKKKEDGWELPLYLADGTYTYRFIADGNWMADPGNPRRFPNEFNDYNSVITIGEPFLFKLDGYANAREVILSGSFNKWRNNELIMIKTDFGWELPYILGAGNYEYQFIVDGKAMADPARPAYITGKKTSYLILHPNYTFHLKGFENARLVYLVGDFNNWVPHALAMKKENGEWIFRVHLAPGKHLYKFIVDGEWIIDPFNKLWEQNEHSNGNSVLWIEK
jgi:hypothetical protein